MMRCTECGTAGEDVIDRVYLVNPNNWSAPDAQPGACLGPLRMCEGCWERRRAAFRRQVETEWRAHVATVTAGTHSREGRRLDGGDAGMRL